MTDNKALIKYNGTDKPLTAKVWMMMFERHAHRLRCSSKDKLLYLDTFLEGSAITWFANEVILKGTNDWEELKDSFLKRFDRTIDEPLTQFMEFRLTKEMDIKEYYEELMRLAQPIGLKEEFLIEALTHGVPVQYRTHIKAAGPTSTQNWLSIASAWERELKRQQARKSVTSFALPRANPGTTRNEKVINGMTPKVPRPCNICARFYNKPNELHWRNDCPNNRNTRFNQLNNMEEDENQGKEMGSLEEN